LLDIEWDGLILHKGENIQRSKAELIIFAFSVWRT